MSDELVALLAKCQPLARKLVTQGYAYEWSKEDMSILDAYRQMLTAAEQEALSDDQVADVIARAGLTSDDMLWLVCLHELQSQAPIVEAAGHPYQPFAQVLDRLEQNVKMSIATGVVTADDAEVVHQPALARTHPLWLVEADRVWRSFSQRL